MVYLKKKKINNIKFPKITILLSLFLFIFIALRGAYLALSTEVDGVNLEVLASKRTSTTEVIEAQRGSIYSSDNEILAQNVSSYKVIAYLEEERTIDDKKPQHVVDIEHTANSLSPLLNIPKEEIVKYLSKENAYQTEFGANGKGLTELQKKQIEDLNLPGIDFIESYKRYYPKGNFSSYTVGYAKTVVDEKNQTEEIIGEMGIEKQYNSILKGEDGSITYQKDLQGYKIADTNELVEEATEGKDIYLTLDSNIQFFVEQALNNAMIDYGYEWFNITIADAKTGAILATSTAPSFDPNIRDIKNYLDYTVALPYEPGSTMKTFTYMAALENGIYDTEKTYKSGVYTTKDGTEIGDWDRAGWGMLTYDQGYTYSSNTGVINLINDGISSLMLRQYYQKLGFGKQTGIELPNEAKGSLKFKYETEIYNAGFGQGITTTPIQHIQAMTSLTNDGIILEPYIIEKIIDPTTSEIILQNEKKEQERVASTKTVEKMLTLLDQTVNGGVTGANYKIESGQLIGKTGTAQIANPNGGGYLSGKQDIISSFSGIYPKDDPEIIIYAAVQRPSNGSQLPISNAVKSIIENISKYYGNDDYTNPNKVEINKYKVPNFKNQILDKSTTNLTTENIKYKIIGNGNKVINQYPKASSEITNKDTVYLFTNEQNNLMPDLTGLSSKDSYNIAKILGLNVKLEGKGNVVSQSIPKDTPLQLNQELIINLNPKFN